ncbi:MAG TPA: hypothetical protein DEG17_11085 [Cyanobacteria bacterium UBA11149]|nr:hypothetical protein [Cyanobacteria bacterium UBA11367]HBE57589.1 hypothetical protein [Cyanobacteria bacterium UBA11366]HBK62543.1 hypothetical protein [Cyanobacteria bacterium UBA11166]HBR77059.1 hypothetical protein [Cyanobacteria bacterium UBA11159]HBS72002.1 hypothetical protein [Cyanobacteria bacterium UBA11153]HBW89393.1 hypothetical protein [Cyanobacteria bacterium UBA11149]HCA97336.1 hypothetical protein [Cyanobacteria bacterium UBA9226]
MAKDDSSRVEEVAREDLVMFINACLSSTGQREFYDDNYGQKVSLSFLHDYILGNYRLLYCRTLAAGINHFNQIQIILKLLETGKETKPENRWEENRLITETLHRLPSHRAWNLLLQIRKRHINNRRARAIVRDYLASRGERLEFDAVKYRSKLQAIATHHHLKLEKELNSFLFRHWQKSFATELFEKFRQGYYSASAIYNLPYTIAEGLAIKHKIPRDIFLARIENQMTVNEKLRLQGSAEKAGIAIAIEPHRLSLTKLALYILSLSPDIRQQRRDELHHGMENSARAALKHSHLELGRVAIVCDRSYSSYGSSEKRRRPLGIALALHYLISVCAREYQAFWTVPTPDSLLVTPYGQTDLATPLLSALIWQPELVIIVSDGWENDPPAATSELLRVYRQKLDPQAKTSIIHCNPVFNPDDLTLKRLSPFIPTVGLRDAEDLPVVLGFARFADGSATLSELEDYLANRVKQLLKIR